VVLRHGQTKLPANGTDLTYSVISMERVNPYRSLKEEVKTQGRSMARRDQTDREKKRMSLGNGADIGLWGGRSTRQTSTTRSRLILRGASHERNLINRSGDQSRYDSDRCWCGLKRRRQMVRHHWPTIQPQRCRLQVRIVRRRRKADRGKVKGIATSVTCSYSGKVLAVRRVTENLARKLRVSDRRNLGHSERRHRQPYATQA